MKPQSLIILTSYLFSLFTGNSQINNLSKNVKNSIVFHAGTKVDGGIKTNGGRVIALTSFGGNIKESLAKSFESAEIISFENKYYRNDIGFDL